MKVRSLKSEVCRLITRTSRIRVTVQPVMEFDNIETVKRAVEIDAGIAIVPQGTIIQEVAKQTLAAVQFEDAQFFRQLAAIYKKNKVLSPAMKQFVAILKESQ